MGRGLDRGADLDTETQRRYRGTTEIRPVGTWAPATGAELETGQSDGLPGAETSS